jgi:hypothetical protein
VAGGGIGREPGRGGHVWPRHIREAETTPGKPSQPSRSGRGRAVSRVHVHRGGNRGCEVRKWSEQRQGVVARLSSVGAKVELGNSEVGVPGGDPPRVKSSHAKPSPAQASPAGASRGEPSEGKEGGAEEWQDRETISTRWEAGVLNHGRGDRTVDPSGVMRRRAGTSQPLPCQTMTKTRQVTPSHSEQSEGKSRANSSGGESGVAKQRGGR